VPILMSTTVGLGGVAPQSLDNGRVRKEDATSGATVASSADRESLCGF
jgi:hypothetical protein